MMLQYRPFFYEKCGINYRYEIKSKYIHNWVKLLAFIPQ